MRGDLVTRLARYLSADEHRSGQAIAGALGCTRAAVWKHVQALRGLGIEVQAARGKGYRLAMPLDMLDRRAVLSACGTEACRALASLDVLFRCDSTNAVLLRRPAGAQHGQAVLAEVQSAGRGRRGRGWYSPFGRNVYLSLGWRFDVGLRSLSCLPLVVALAAASAIQRAGLNGPRVKWPNDLVVDGRKLAGCLVEIQGDLNGPCLAVMGVGVNVHMQGDAGAKSIDQPWTDLSSHVPDASRNALAGYLITALLADVQRFERDGFQPFRSRWRALDALAGRNVSLQRGAERIRGLATGVGDHGGLMLQAGGRVHEYLAGEVTTC